MIQPPNLSVKLDDFNPIADPKGGFCVYGLEVGVGHSGGFEITINVDFRLDTETQFQACHDCGDLDRDNYNESLRRRGDLTVWINEEALGLWSAPSRKTRSGQRRYSELAIEQCLIS